MDLEEIKNKKAAGEKLTAGEEFFLKKNSGPEKEAPVPAIAPADKPEAAEAEKGPIVLKDKPDKKEKEREKTLRQAQGKKKEKKAKPEKIPRQARGKIKYPPFYKNVFSEYRAIWSALFGIMAIALIVGFVLPNDFKITLLTEIFGKFTHILEGVQTTFQLALAIFLNNLEVSALLLVLGITVVVPILVVVSNGLMIGIFFDFIVRLEAIEPGILLSSIIGVIPHGIIEIPVFVFTASFGVALLIKLIAPKKFIPNKSRSRVLLDIVLRYLLIVLPLFLLAAFIEAYISPLLSNKIDDTLSARFQNEQLAEYGPDKVLLAQKNCTEVHEENVVPDSMLSSSSQEQLRIIFDEKIFKQIEAYRNVPKYTESYICGEEGLQIRIMELNYTEFIDYIAMQKQVFRELGYDIEEIDEGLLKLSKEDVSYYYGYTQKSDFIFMIVSYFGEDEAMIRAALEK
ncbi:stage II sporulation protein M [Patescibacteria group bacterium]|nr:stage II sporulation protein M [Patescibacteria group bacterium]MBU1673458.1 stage II sporulation protein M [Patescibacteria group bacterium]MBU1962920.1 stage II sporulation protein M [Patescibacteria group bacterium]